MTRAEINKIITLKKQMVDILAEINAILMAPESQLDDITPDQVINEVCALSKMSRERILPRGADGRKGEVVIWRKVIIFILFKYSHLRPANIKRIMGYTSTGSHIIMNSYRDVENWFELPYTAPANARENILQILHNLGYESKESYSQQKKRA